MTNDFTQSIQHVGKAVEKAVNADGSFLATNNVISQSVAHLHTHIVPRKKQDGLKGFFWPRQKFTAEAMQAVQLAIKNNLTKE